MESNKRNIYPVMNNNFGEFVISLSKEITTEPFWERSEQHLLSVLGAYISSEMDLLLLSHILLQSQVVLENNQDWNSLSTLILSTKNANLKEKLMNDALFHFENGWEQQEINRRNMTIQVALKRINIALDKSFSITGKQGTGKQKLQDFMISL